MTTPAADLVAHPLFVTSQEIARDQPAIRIDNRAQTINPRIAGYATEAHIAMIAPTADSYLGETRALADFPIGANFLARKRDGSLAFYRVTGRTVGSLLVSEVV